MTKPAGQGTFVERMRCEKTLPSLARYDVAEGDDDRMRRWKWNDRAITIRYSPCSNGNHCPRCVTTFLDAFNQPIGPWA